MKGLYKDLTSESPPLNSRVKDGLTLGTVTVDRVEAGTVIQGSRTILCLVSSQSGSIPTPKSLKKYFLLTSIKVCFKKVNEIVRNKNMKFSKC